MSKIDELLEELCPEGVDWKSLGEVGTFVRGNGLQKKDFTSEGVGCIHYGQIYTHYGIYATKTKSFVAPELARKLKKASKNDLIIAGVSENVEDVCKAVAWLGKEDICISGDAFIYKHQQNPKYIAYLFQTPDFFEFKKKYAQGAKVTRLQSGSLPKYVIPVPPLPIQEEIVKILDSFTALEAELEAELEARAVQFLYYRNKLLAFEGEDVEWKSLGEVCLKTSTIKWKENKEREYLYIDLSSVNRNNNSIEEPQIITSKNAPSRAQQIVLENDVIFGTTRPTLKRYALISKEFEGQICSTGFCVLRANQRLIIPKFLFFILTTNLFYDFIENNQEGAGYPSIANSKVKSFLFPVPPLAEQERIVKILDQFDGLVNNISVGLPAEIAARRQQYEYYRNKLLTFKPRYEHAEL